MDSLTQMALGSAVGVAVMGRRVPVWRSALAGALYGTLPDLDALIDYGDPIRNMTFHRGFSHSLFYLTLASPLLAWLGVRLVSGAGLFRRWWLAVWLILMTHVLLDTLTIYGTQIGQPFTDYPFEVGSVFIIDPFYTLLLLLGLIVAIRGRPRGNTIGLAVSSLYLLWSLGAQQYVEYRVDRQLADSGWPVERRMVTPTPFNTLLWRVLVMTPEGYREGFYSLVDGERSIDFDRFDRNVDLYRQLHDIWGVQRMAWFSHGFFKMDERNGRVRITDLRMGQEPFYSFNFVVAERTPTGLRPVPYQLEMEQPDIGASLRWLGMRALGSPLPPPRPEPRSGLISEPTLKPTPEPME